MEWTLGLGVLASLAAALLIGLAELLLRKRAERKLDAAMAELQSLRDSVTRLDEALHPILTPAREAGDATANTAVQKWKNGLSVAISHLQFTVPDLPQRPGLDLDLVDRIERMEQMADEAVKELGQQAGLCGQRGDEAVNNLIKRVKRAAFGFTNFDNYRIRALLYAGKPDWTLLQTLTPT